MPHAMRLAGLLLFLFIVVAIGCSEERPGREHPAPPDRTDVDAAQPGTVERLSDVEKLMLIERLPLRSSYADVRAVFPTVGPEEPSGTGMLDQLSTAVVPVEVLGRDALLEFNFDDATLYSYYFRLDSLDCDDAAHLTDRLRTRYSSTFGRAHHEAEQEPGYATDSSYWQLPQYDGALALTLGRQADVCRLAWGYQVETP